MFRRATVGFVLSAGLLLAQTALAQIKVVATFSILADMVTAIGGDLVTVKSLVGPDSDAHAYQPSPTDARKLAEAQLVVVNGLGFEGWLDRLVGASGTRAEIVVASKGVTTLAMARHAGHKHAKGSDPHAWHDARNGIRYVENIAKALAAIDPAHAERYQGQGAAYAAKIGAVDAEIRRAIDAVPTEKRKVITSHDAFRYFGAAYGVTFLAAQGVGAEREPTAKDIARLVEQVRKAGVKALFVENISDPRLIEQIARESGGIVGPPLFSDALSKSGGPTDSYPKMLLHNAAALARGMAIN